MDRRPGRQSWQIQNPADDANLNTAVLLECTQSDNALGTFFVFLCRGPPLFLFFRIIEKAEEVYLGLRRGEALGLQWGDFDFDEDLVHVQRDIDFCGSTARDGDLKTDAADRYVPIPGELRAMLTKMRGFPQQYVFHTETGQPWPQSSFKRIWLSLMEDAHCV